jgi:hypothetical protein
MVKFLVVATASCLASRAMALIPSGHRGYDVPEAGNPVLTHPTFDFKPNFVFILTGVWARLDCCLNCRVNGADPPR